MDDCTPTQASMKARLKSRKQSQAPPVDLTMHMSIVGSLRYLVNTRSDLACSVGIVVHGIPHERIHGYCDTHITVCQRDYGFGSCNEKKDKGDLYLTGYNDITWLTMLMIDTSPTYL
jgi:hypothetical protein